MPRQPPRPSAHARHDPYVVQQTEIAVALAVGREGQQAAVGRPRRLDVVPIAVGDLARLATCDVEHEQMFPERLQEAFAVGFVVHAADDLDAWWLALFVRLAFLSGDLLDIDAGAERQAVTAR